MNPRVKSVRALDDYQLEVSFDNGERRIFDVKPYLSRGIFVRLRDRSLFHAARVVAGSVEWPTGVDLSYETLYTEGRPSLERSDIAEETAEASKAIREGAFAFVDCLGWKGIWNCKAAESTIALIHKIEEIPNDVGTWLEDMRLKEQNEFRPIETKILLISDTVAVSIRQKDSQPSDSLDQAYLVTAAALSVNRIQKLFLTDKPPIAMRGCIAFGEHAVINNFIIGRAVDEAADCYEAAEGALVWLLPSAHNPVASVADTFSNYGEGLFIPYDVPLKGGHRLRSLVLNPLYPESADQRQSIINRYNEAMMSRADRLDVWLKVQHTFEFLAAAQAASAAFEDKNNPQRT